MRIKSLIVLLIASLSVLTVTISIAAFAIYREGLALSRAYTYYQSALESLESIATATSIPLTTTYNFEATSLLIDRATAEIDQRLTGLSSLENLTTTTLSDQYISIVRIRLQNLRQISTALAQKVDLGQCFSFNYSTFRQRVASFTAANARLNTKDTAQIRTVIDELTQQAGQVSSTISDLLTCFNSSKNFVSNQTSQGLNSSKYYFEALINGYSAVSQALQDKNTTNLDRALEGIKKLDTSQVEILKPRFLQSLDQTVNQTIDSSLSKEKEYGQKISIQI